MQPMPLEPEPWPTRAARLIRIFARSGLEFTAEDIERGIGKPPHPSLMGNAFNAASTSRLIIMAGTKRSATPSRKGGLIRLWEGTELAREEVTDDCA